MKDGFKKQNHLLSSPSLTKRKWKSAPHSGINHAASTVDFVHTHTSLPETDYAKRSKGHEPHLGFSASVTVCVIIHLMCVHSGIYSVALYNKKENPNILA